MATVASTPNVTETVSPTAAVDPNAVNAHAATPSRGPQPATLSGIAAPSSTSAPIGSSCERRQLDADGRRGDQEDDQVPGHGEGGQEQHRATGASATQQHRGQAGPAPAAGQQQGPDQGHLHHLAEPPLPDHAAPPVPHARCTSPTTPPGSVALISCER